MTDVFTRKEEVTQRDTQERPCGSRGRWWSDAITSQGMPKAAGSHQKLGESMNQILPQRLQKESVPLTP